MRRGEEEEMKEVGMGGGGNVDISTRSGVKEVIWYFNSVERIQN